MGAGDCGSVDDQRRPLRNFPPGGQGFGCLGAGELQAFNQPANQQASQSNSQPTDWPFCQPVKLQTQHALANRSGISASAPVESGATADTKVLL